MNDRTVEVIQAAIKENFQSLLEVHESLHIDPIEEALLITILLPIRDEGDRPVSELNEHQLENRKRIMDFIRWYNKTSYEEA